MQPTLDLNQITDIKELKALAYDQLALKEQCEENLRNINIRMAQVINGPAPDPKDEGTPEPTEDGASSKGEPETPPADPPAEPQA